jgi:hypothetical protein
MNVKSLLAFASLAGEPRMRQLLISPDGMPIAVLAAGSEL